MSGKELLAVLLMISPSVAAVALVTFTLVQCSGVAPAAKAAGKVAQAEERPAASARTATQKRMRDPWEKAVYTKTSSAPGASRCGSDRGNQEMLCYHW